MSKILAIDLVEQHGSVEIFLMVRLSIIILTYNTKELTINCIRSLLNNYKKELQNGEFEIIVVDNASTDGTSEEISNLKSQIANLTLVKNTKNYGFSKGNNVGAKKARGKYLLFLNSDTEVLDNGIAGMVDFLEEHQGIGILGGRLHNIDGSTQKSAGHFFNLFNTGMMLFFGERLSLVKFCPQKAERVDWVSGACFMIRKNLFDKLKGFDEYFFMYVEDMELCFRAKKEAFLTYFYPNVKILHRELGSSNRSFAIKQIYKGILYFYKRHIGAFQYAIVKIMLVSKAMLAILLGIMLNNNYLRNTYKKAMRF